MAGIENLKRQHKEIEEIINSIEQDIQNNLIESKAIEIVKSISYLSGILSMHLRQENEFIYPNLINSNYEDYKEISNLYLAEMDEIAESFNKYKNKFNTSRKILNHIDTFKEETNKLFGILKERTEKENTELYPFLSSLNDREFIKIAMTRKEE